MTPWLPPDRAREAAGAAAVTKALVHRGILNGDRRGKGAADRVVAAVKAVLLQSKAARLQISARCAPVLRPGADGKSGADGLAA